MQRGQAAGRRLGLTVTGLVPTGVLATTVLFFFLASSTCGLVFIPIRTGRTGRNVRLGRA